MLHRPGSRTRPSLLSLAPVPQRKKRPWHVIEEFPDVNAEAVSSNARTMSAMLKYSNDGDLPNLFADSLNNDAGKGEAVPEYGDFLRQLHDLDAARASGFERQVDKKLTPDTRKAVHAFTRKQEPQPSRPRPPSSRKETEERKVLNRRDWFMEFFPRLEGRESEKFTDLKGDDGGPTKFGATRKEFGAYKEENGNNASNMPSDVKNLTREQAQKFFRDHYYDRYRAGNINHDEIAEHLFDATVNPGPARSARCAGGCQFRKGYESHPRRRRHGIKDDCRAQQAVAR